MHRATLTLHPSASVRAWISVIATPFIVYPLWHLPGLVGTPDWTITAALSVVAVIGLGLWLLLEVWTVRVHLTSVDLCLNRYWSTRWRVPREHAILQRGGVGDPPILPGFQVIDARVNKQIGAIAFSQFRRADLEELERALSRKMKETD